jgi:hypothetical protein
MTDRPVPPKAGYLFKCPRCSHTLDTFRDAVRYLFPPDEVLRQGAEKAREHRRAGYERAKHMHIHDECIGQDPPPSQRGTSILDLLAERKAIDEGRVH